MTTWWTMRELKPLPDDHELVGLKEPLARRVWVFTVSYASFCSTAVVDTYRRSRRHGLMEATRKTTKVIWAIFGSATGLGLLAIFINYVWPLLGKRWWAIIFLSVFCLALLWLNGIVKVYHENVVNDLASQNKGALLRSSEWTEKARSLETHLKEIEWLMNVAEVQAGHMSQWVKLENISIGEHSLLGGPKHIDIGLSVRNYSVRQISLGGVFGRICIGYDYAELNAPPGIAFSRSMNGLRSGSSGGFVLRQQLTDAEAQRLSSEQITFNFHKLAIVIVGLNHEFTERNTLDINLELTNDKILKSDAL